MRSLCFLHWYYSIYGCFECHMHMWLVLKKHISMNLHWVFFFLVNLKKKKKNVPPYFPIIYCLLPLPPLNFLFPLSLSSSNTQNHPLMWTHSTFLHLLRSKVNVLCELPLYSLDFEVVEEEVQGVLDCGYGAFWDVVMKVCRFVLWWKMLSLMGDWVMGGIQILYFLCSILYSSNHNLLYIFFYFPY